MSPQTDYILIAALTKLAFPLAFDLRPQPHDLQPDLLDFTRCWRIQLACSAIPLRPYSTLQLLSTARAQVGLSGLAFLEITAAPGAAVAAFHLTHTLPPRRTDKTHNGRGTLYRVSSNYTGGHMQLTTDQFTCHHNFNWTEPPADCWPTDAEHHAPRIALILSRDGTVVPTWAEEWYAESRMPILAAPDSLAKQLLRDEINTMGAALGRSDLVVHPQFHWLAVGVESLIPLVPEGPAARDLHQAIDRWYLVVFGMQQLINPKFDDHLENIMPNLLYARDRADDPSWMALVRLQTLAAGLQKHVEIERSNRT